MRQPWRSSNNSCRLSNLPDNRYEVGRPDPLNTDEATLKLDHYISPTHNIAFSYFYLTGTDTQPLSLSGNIPWVDRDFKWNQHNVNVADTWTLSPTVINQFRVTFVRQFGGRVNNPTTSLGDLNSKFTIQGDPTLPRLTVSGYFTGQTSIAGPDAGSDYFSVKDTVSMSRGNHSFKFGGEVSYEEIVHDTLLDNYGVFAFNASKTGNAYADFLLGLPSTMTQDAPVRKTDNGAYISLFAQDDFRISSKVTLNLGLRYDLQFPYTDPQNRKLAYVPGEQSQVSPTAPIGLLFPGDPGISRGIVKTDYNNIAPRVGVAWDPLGDGRMVGSSRRRRVLRQHYGQRVEHDGRQPALHGASAISDGEDALGSVRQPARGRRSVPVHLRSGQPEVHAARASVRPVARLRVAVFLPDEFHD